MDEDKSVKVLIIDDSEIAHKQLGEMLRSQGYSFESALNGPEGLEAARRGAPDIVFLDLIMPEMDGFEVCRRFKGNPETRRIPIVMITVAEDRESRLKALECGVNDFLTKPFDPVELTVRMKNLLRIKEYEDLLSNQNERLEDEVKRRTEQLKLTLIELSKTNRELEESRKVIKRGYIDTVHRLTTVAEYKDSDTARHIARVGRLCAALTESMGWGRDDVEAIFYASPMHDIGKVGIPSEILLKHGSLTVEEMSLMKTHAPIGAKILEGSGASILQMAGRIAATHHERWDGGGYPLGLKGDEVPIEGYIMNIVDQYDALRSERPYKRAVSHADTYRVITEGDDRTRPTHFHPVVFDTFKRVHKRFDDIYEAYK